MPNYAATKKASPKSIAINDLVSRLELAYADLELPADVFARLCLAILPEEYSDNGRPPSPLSDRALPHTSRRIRELAERYKHRQHLFRSDDPDADDGEGILLEPITLDNPSGALAPKSRWDKALKEDVLVEYTYQQLRGSERAELPECSDRCIREGDLKREKDGAKATVELLRTIFDSKRDAVKTFPDRLREARRRRRWPLRVVAKKSGYTQAHLSLLERGRRYPSYDTLQCLAEVYGGSNLTVAEMLLTAWPD
jgi:hypothetical protein